MDISKNIKKGSYAQAEVVNQTDGSIQLKFNKNWTPADLPSVSVVTITKNRLKFVAIMLYNWNHFNYPPEKLEWIVVDDSDTDNLQYYLPLDDSRVKYVYLDKHHTIADKRNVANSHASHEFIVHMDDDDYYFPDSILSKICVLLEYNKMGVHSMPMAVYDMIQDKSFVMDCYGNGNRQTNAISEASIAYRKEYWRQHPFEGMKGVANGGAEGTPFVGKRFKDWILLPFYFNTISITHKTNYTNKTRSVNQEQPEHTSSFKLMFPDLFINVLENIKNLIS